MHCFPPPSTAVSPSGPTAQSEMDTLGSAKKNKIEDRTGPDLLSVDNFASTTWNFFFKENNRKPVKALPAQPVDLSLFNCPDTNQLNVTWLGHSSLMINIDGYRVLTDPVFVNKVSILGPARFNGQVPVGTHQLPFIDAVVISHDHYDHLNKSTIKQLVERTGRFIVPLGVGERIAKWGVPQSKIAELDWWDAVRIEPDLTLTATPAQHFSGRGLTDHNRTLWASWVIATPWHNLFFSGDSGYFDGFKEIGIKYGPFDMTFLECGAYNESWAKVHMFPEQTVQAHLDLNGDILHPIHWGTFNLSLHPWYEPMDRVAAAAAVAGVTLATPIVGETIVYDESLSTSDWWREAMIQQTSRKLDQLRAEPSLCPKQSHGRISDTVRSHCVLRERR